jgi:hypothetical protein
MAFMVRSGHPDHTHARFFKLAGVETNVILECKFLFKNKVHAAAEPVPSFSSAPVTPNNMTARNPFASSALK